MRALDHPEGLDGLGLLQAHYSCPRRELPTRGSSPALSQPPPGLRTLPLTRCWHSSGEKGPLQASFHLGPAASPGGDLWKGRQTLLVCL